MRKALRDITKSKTILVIYFLLFILLLVSSIIVIKDTAAIRRRYDVIVDTSMYKIGLMKENYSNIEQIQATTIKNAFHPNSLMVGDQRQAQQNFSKTETNLKEFSKHINSDEEDSLFKKVNIFWQQYKLSRKKFVELSDDDKKALAYYNAEEKNAYENFCQLTNQLSGYVYNNIKKEDTAIDKFTFYSQVRINALIAAIVLLLIILGISVVKNIKKINYQHKDLVIKEKELQASEYLYRNLFDKSPLPKWVCDRTTLQLYEVNEAAVKLYGYCKEEFLKLTVFDLKPKEDHEKLRSSIKRHDFVSRNDGIRKHITKEGKTIFVEINLDNIFYKGKEAILVALHDVTEKLRIEERLKQEEEFFRSITENSSDIQLVTNKEGKITFASQSVFNIFGFNQNEIIGKSSKDFWHPADVKKNKEKIADLINKPGSFLQFEVRCLDKDKHYRWCETRISNQLHNPSIRGFVSNYSDITERKNTDEKLEASEELYRSLFNKSPLPIFVTDKKTMKLLEANEAAIELYGYSRKELLTMTAFEIRDKEDHLLLKEAIQNINTAHYRNNGVHHVKKNGEKIIVDVISETVPYKNGEAFLAIVRDITETLKLQNQLNEEKIGRQREMTKATIDGQEKERTELGKELHDNINQILACAKLYLSSANKADIARKDELIEETKGLIDSGIQEIRKLSKSLVPPSLSKSTLKESIEELIDPIRITTDTQIETIFSLFDESGLCDKIKITIYRIIQEQMNNILKYAEASKIRVILKQDNSKLLLQVKDNGKGFDVKAKRKGIGLTNISNRAEVYNGKVVIDSAPGNGCILSVFFPLEHLQHSGNGVVSMSAPGMAS